MLYRAAWWPLSVVVTVWLWWRGRKEAGYRAHLAERWGHVAGDPSAMGGLWIHAASVGEVQAALVLLPQLEQDWGAHAITWTVQTPAGRDVLLERTQGRAKVFYAPMDLKQAVTRFLDRVQPRMLLLLERELWPEWLWQCEQHAIQVALVNARLTERSAQRSGALMRLLKLRLAQLACVACADSNSQARFASQGVPASQLHETGNLKFESTRSRQSESTAPLATTGRRVVVAASTHAADEAAILGIWPLIAQRYPDTLLVLAPRHSPRFDDVAAHLGSTGLQFVRRSHHEPVSSTTQVLLLDTLGELADCYAGAYLALMGGTWADVGGHSPLEALAQGCPVLMGPNVHQFPELYGAIDEHGAGEQLSAADLANTLAIWLDDRSQRDQAGLQGKTFWLSQQGAKAKTHALLTQLRGWPRHPMDEVAVERKGNTTVWWNISASSTSQRSQGFETGTDPRHLPTGSGRGQVTLMEREGNTWLLRHYRRGGLVAKWNPDRYAAQPVPLTRAMREMTLLREMISLGLAVPTPIAARCIQKGWHYQADIIVGYLAGTNNLAQLLSQRALEPQEWASIGQAIRQMHDHQIYHSDLNCHNILLDIHRTVWLIDFDKCERRLGEKWKQPNLLRLRRSLLKESTQQQDFNLESESLHQMLYAYSTRQSEI
jgi:3-deoxy-D-manno-octulosonic-acid transferase